LEDSRGSDLPLRYTPSLDGLRAVAIAAVVLYHATDFTFPATGLLGVDLFFVLSGFLITTLLLDEQRRAEFVGLGSFYRRRARRLLPAALVLLAVFSAVAVVVTDRREALLGVAAGLAYVMNYALAAGHAEAVPTELAHLWSLSAEEQFYLVWPVLLLGFFRGRVGLAAWSCAAGIVLVQLRAFDLLGSEASFQRIEFGVDTRSLSILVGCLLALVLVGRANVPRVPQRLELVAPVLFVALLVIDWKRSVFAGPLLVTAFCSAVLVVQSLDRTSPVSRVLSVSPMVFLGRISYGLYLWHLPVLAAFGVLGAGLTPMAIPAVAVAVVAATASYYLVERPFLRRRSRPAAEAELRPAPAPEVVVALQTR
jgi:peptidoglycan/LPS O-acetylase OafA/YrhL